MVPEKSLGNSIRKICYKKICETSVKKKTLIFSPIFRTQKIYDGDWYRTGTGTGQVPVPIFFRILVVSELVSEKCGTGKSLGTGIGKNWYQKKVSEPVSEKFETEKKYRFWYCLKFWVLSDSD